jgi:putative transposase
MPFYNNQLRLSLMNYLGRRIYFVTIVTAQRRPFFEDRKTGQWLLTQLLEISAHFDFTQHAYCVMPDHLHFLSEGRSDTSNLLKFVSVFKQRTAYEFTTVTCTRLWQKRYYDHVLRPNDRIEGPACYIWSNPVRKNLAVNPSDYPLSGSQTIDWMKYKPTVDAWSPPWKQPL